MEVSTAPFDIVTFQWCTGYSINECSAEVSHVLQSRTEFTANFASNFYDTWIVIWSTLAVHFCLNPTLRYVHIIYPAVHGSCTDVLFCHACLVNATCNFSKHTVKKGQQWPLSHRAVGHTGHVTGMSRALGLVTWFSCLKMLLLQLLLWYYLLN